jgi:hypothetical protein
VLARPIVFTGMGRRAGRARDDGDHEQRGEVTTRALSDRACAVLEDDHDGPERRGVRRGV